MALSWAPCSIVWCRAWKDFSDGQPSRDPRSYTFQVLQKFMLATAKGRRAAGEWTLPFSCLLQRLNLGGLIPARPHEHKGFRDRTASSCPHASLRGSSHERPQGRHCSASPVCSGASADRCGPDAALRAQAGCDTMGISVMRTPTPPQPGGQSAGARFGRSRSR